MQAQLASHVPSRQQSGAAAPQEKQNQQARPRTHPELPAPGSLAPGLGPGGHPPPSLVFLLSPDQIHKQPRTAPQGQVPGAPSASPDLLSPPPRAAPKPQGSPRTGSWAGLRAPRAALQSGSVLLAQPPQSSQTPGGSCGQGAAPDAQHPGKCMHRCRRPLPRATWGSRGTRHCLVENAVNLTLPGSLLSSSLNATAGHARPRSPEHPGLRPSPSARSHEGGERGAATLTLQKTVGRSQIHRIHGFPHLGTVPKTCVVTSPRL